MHAVLCKVACPGVCHLSRMWKATVHIMVCVGAVSGLIHKWQEGGRLWMDFFRCGLPRCFALRSAASELCRRVLN